MSLQDTPASIRQRLYNPPNGHHSDEREIVSGIVAKRQRFGREMAAQAQAEREARLLRDARATRAAELMSEYQFKLTAWVLAGLTEPAPPAIPKLLFEQIIMTVSEFYSVPRIQIMSHRRTSDITRIRQIAMYLGRDLTEQSLPMLGAKMGRDHTTVLHGANKIADALAAGNERLAAEIAEIKRRLAEG